MRVVRRFLLTLGILLLTGATVAFANTLGVSVADLMTNSSAVSVPKSTTSLSSVANQTSANTGTTISGTATLSGGTSGAQAVSGTITFYLLGPSASAPTTCPGAATAVGTKSVNAGNGAYALSITAPSTAGNYWWYVSYGGDSNNSASNGACGDNGDKVVLTAAVPTATSVSPTSRGQGASTQTITVNGSNFVSGATVSFSGTGITLNGSPTFVNSSQLTVSVSISATAATGSRNVTVTNPDLTSGTCTACFTVNTGPTVTSVSPSSYDQRGSTSVTITGANFVSGTGLAASFGANITVNSTTFVSSTQVVANITISATAAIGARGAAVTNPDAGTGSCSACFTVLADSGPKVVSVASTNHAGGSAGLVEVGDTLSVTFDRPLDPTTVPTAPTMTVCAKNDCTPHENSGVSKLVIPGLTPGFTVGTSYVADNSTASAGGTVALSAGNTVVTFTVTSVSGTFTSGAATTFTFTPATSIKDLGAVAASGSYTTPAALQLF